MILLRKIFKDIVPLFVLIFAIQACSGSDDSNNYDSETYEQAVSDFYMSLGASQTDQTRFAFNKVNDVALAYPEEPAAWANLGVYAMRQGNFDLAKDRIEVYISETDSEISNQFETVKELFKDQNFIDLSLELSFLRSGLESTSSFQQDLLQIQLPPTDVGFLIPQFLHLPLPDVSVTSPDMMMR